MAKILVVGRVTDRFHLRTGFPELRTSTFVRVLTRAGHDVRVAGLVPPDALEQGAGIENAVLIAEEGPGWLDAVASAARGADLLVGAGPHNASRAACLVAGDRPVFADVPGDPFAEVQAIALSQDHPQPQRQAGALAAFLPVLARADRFAVVSHRQRHLLLGQLGLCGRLIFPDCADLVDILPITWDFELPPAPTPPRAAGSPLRVALVGSENAWLDLPTLTASLDLAHARMADLDVVLVGGSALRSWATDRRWVQTLGRLRPSDLRTALSQAHVGLVLDRPGLEPETGSRTRVLFLLHQGLDLVATTKTELCAELAEEDLIHPVPCGDPQAVATVLQRLHDHASTTRPHRAQRVLSHRYQVDRAAAALLRFAETPTRATSASGEFAQMADLAREHARLRGELARIHSSPTWRLLSRIHRRWT